MRGARISFFFLVVFRCWPLLDHGLCADRQQRGNGLPERDAGRVFAGPGVGTSPKARERFCEGPPRTGRVSFVHTGGSSLIV